METMSVEEVVSKQKKQRLEQQRTQLNRWLRRIFFHGFMLLFVGWLIFSPRFDLHISLVNQGVLSRQDINQLIKQPYYNKVYFAFAPLVFEELNQHPLIKELIVEPYAIGSWELYITQYRPIALWFEDSAILLENGVSYGIDQAELWALPTVPILNGYEDPISHQPLSQAMLQIEEGSLSLISEIIQEAKSYDINYAHLIMQDGNHVYSSLLTFHVLNDYMAIKRALNPEHNCIVIDEITSVPYSFTCTP